MSDEQFKRLMERLDAMRTAISGISITLVLLGLAGCAGCYSLNFPAR